MIETVCTSTIFNKLHQNIENGGLSVSYLPKKNETVIRYRLSLDSIDKIDSINDSPVNSFCVRDNTICIEEPSKKLWVKFKEEYLASCSKKIVKRYWREKPCQCCVEEVEEPMPIDGDSDGDDDANVRTISIHTVEVPFVWVDILYKNQCIH